MVLSCNVAQNRLRSRDGEHVGCGFPAASPLAELTLCSVGTRSWAAAGPGCPKGFLQEPSVQTLE